MRTPTNPWKGAKILIPVRCFTCGAVIADNWERYADDVRRGEDPGKVLDNLGVKRYCCRRMFLSHVDVIDEVARFYERKTVE